jgi:hypothetical protein
MVPIWEFDAMKRMVGDAMAGRLDPLVNVAGEVVEADVMQKRFQLRVGDRHHVSVNFTEPQEDQVTTALRDHKAVRMKVTGRGEMSPEGKLLRITKVEKLEILPASEAALDKSGPPIEDILEELAGEVPQAEWDKLPVDLTDNLDHYLYGTPKR